MKLLFCFFSLISLFSSSHIYTKDPLIDFSNAGYFSNIGIPFMLTSPLSSNDYLNLITSFSLHSAIQNTPSNYSISNYFTPSNLFMNLSSYSSECQIPSSKTPALAFTKSVDSTKYLIRFTDAKNNFIGLNQGVWYVLWVNMTDSNVLNMQVPNTLLQIQLKTISDSGDSPIQYDFNPVISIFQLLDAPPKTLQVSLLYDNPNQQNVLSANNLVYIDLTTTVVVQSSPSTIKYFLSDNSFQFNGQCISVAKTDNPTISAFSTSDYTCFVNPSDNSITVSFFKPIKSAFSLRIKVFILNPPRVIKSATINVLSLYNNQGIIAETGQSASFLSTVNIPFSLNKLNVAWNINPANSSSFPFPMKLVRADSASPGYLPYNSFVLNFAVQTSTPINLPLRLNVDLITPTGCTFLTGSISETLPAFDSNTQVSCQLVSTGDQNRKIQCTGLGQLVAMTTYKLGFRMAFPYDIYYAPMTIQNAFGVLYIESFNTYLNDYDENYLVPRTSPQNLQTLSSVNNKNWLPTGATYQRQAVSSQISSSVIADPGTSGNLGISTSTNSQRLIFSLHAPYSDISSSSSVAGTSITNSAGLYIMTNNIFPQTASTTASFEDSTGATDASISVSVSSSSNADIMYGLITFSASNSNGLLKAFASAAADKIFAFKPFTITQTCSIYSDNGNYDFYVVSVDGIAGTYNQQTFNNYALINAQCLTPSSFASVKVGISNFWTGNSDSVGSLSGSDFPALLYISGKLSSTEATNVNKLVVFLQNVEPFPNLQNYFDNQNYMYCNNMENKFNCSGVVNPNPDYINFLTMNKVEFKVTAPTLQFSVVIPIKTLVNQNKVYVYFATMTSSSYYANTKNYYNILAASKLFSWTFTASASALSYPFLSAGLSSPNYGIDASCLTCYPGNIVDTNLKIGHSDTGVLSSNDATNFGAGFTYISTTNYTTASTVFTSTISSSDNPCLTFQYSPDQSATLKYGIFCPYMTGTVGSSSVIGITKVQLPYINGRFLKGGIGIFSFKTGTLASAKLETGTISYKGTISNLALSPNKFVKGVMQSRIVWTFQTTNPISNNNYIRVTFSDLRYFQSSSNSFCVLRYSNGSSISHTCTIVSDNLQSFSYSIGTNQPISAGKFDLIHYAVDSTNQDGSDTTFDIYLYSQFLSDDNYIIDQSSNTNPGKFGYNNNPSNSIIPSVSLTASFNNKNCNSKGFFDIGFQVNSRGLYPTESIVLDSTLFYNNMNNLDYECVVLNSNKHVSNDFKSLSFSSSTQLHLFAKSEILSFSSYYYLRCYHIIFPSIVDLNGGFNISAFVATNANLAITPQTNIYVNPFNHSTTFNYFELSFLSKDVSSPGNSQDLQFSITPTSSDLNNTSKIFVWFPYYYPPMLNSDGMIYCRINEMDIACEVDQIRRIVVKYLPFTLKAGNSFTLRIMGPQQGIVQFYSSFYVALDLDSDESYYSELGSIDDIEYKVLSQYTLVNLMVYSLNFTNTYIRNQINTSFSFFLPNSLGLDLLSSYTYFLVEFPSFYNILLNVTSPICVINNVDEKILFNYAQSCSVIGSQIQILLAKDLSQGYNYNIQINGVKGPSWSTCVSKRWIISLISGDQKILVARTFFNTENIGLQSFGFDPNKQLLSYYTADTITEIKSYQITPGVFSSPIIVAETNAFDKSFMLTPNSKSIFVNNPSSLSSKTGTLQTTFQIACPQNTSNGIHYFSLDKSGDSNYYTDLPIIPINVTNSPITFNFDVSSFSIPVGSTNFIIIITEPSQMPLNDITLNFYLSEDAAVATGLNLLQNNIKMDQNKKYGFISLSSQYNQSFVSQSANLLMNISGTNANSYSLSTNSLTLNIVANSSYSLSVSITTNSNPSAVLTDSFTMSCSASGIGYYQLVNSDCSFIGISNVISYINNFYQYNLNDLCQTQFGVVYFEGDGLTKTINIAHLKANKNYTIFGFCQDFVSNYSEVQSQNFTSKDNGGQLMKMQFTFQSNLSRTNEERIVCYLTTLLSVPPQRVITSNLVYCSTFVVSRILQTNTTIISNLTNSTNSSNTTNISYFPLDIYFLPIDDREIDTTSQIISTLTNDTINFMNWVSGNITGLPNLISINPAYPISNSIIPSFSSYSYANLSVYDYNISVNNLSLNSNGSIYLIIYPGILANDTTPSYSQIINNNKADGTAGFKALRVQFIYSKGASVGVNFTNLNPNTSYVIAYFGTNENPSYQDFLKTEIKKLNATTKNIIRSSFGKQLNFISMLTVWILAIIAFG